MLAADRRGYDSRVIAANRVLSRVWPLVLVAAVCCVARGSGPATLVLYNGVVMPLAAQDEAYEAYEAIAVAGDRILALGTNEQVTALAGPETEVVDLAGRTVLPGFIDAHAHLLRDCARAGLTAAEAQTLALSYGVTSVAEMLVEPGDVERYVAMAEAGVVRVRTHLFLAYNSLCGNVYGTWYTSYEPFVETAPRLSIGGVKVFVERSSCSAEPPAISFSDELRPLLSPAGAVWYGEDRPLFSIEELALVIRGAADAGFPCALHAIGDAAVETALRAALAAGDRARLLRPLLLHSLFVRDDLLPLYARSGATPVVEPVNVCFVDTYDDMLPPAHAGIVRRIGDLAVAADFLAAGSDWPWCDPGGLNPLFRVANLVSTTNASPSYASWEPCEALSPRQVVSVWQALRMVTAEAARALHLEDELGTLEPGKKADLAVLSANPLTAPTERLAGVRAALTVVGGRIEWRETPSSD